MKKVTAGFLLLVILFTFSSCGNGDAGGGQTPSPGNASPDSYFVWEDESTKSVVTSLSAEGLQQKSIVFPASVTVVQYAGISETLESVAFANPDTQIQGMSFLSCTNLKSFTFPQNTVLVAENVLAYCEALEEIVIPDGVTTIEHDAFHGCTSLKKVKFGSSLELIDKDAFMGCSALESLEIPALKEIGRNAFRECSSLKSVSLPEGLEIIGDSAFYENTALESINLPQTLKTAGSSIFSFCSSLGQVEIPASLETAGYSAFDTLSLATKYRVKEGSYADLNYVDITGDRDGTQKEYY